MIKFLHFVFGNGNDGNAQLTVHTLNDVVLGIAVGSKRNSENSRRNTLQSSINF